MVVASYISPKAVKGRASSIDGRGLFAVEPIHAGGVVAVKGGHLVDAATLAGLPERLRNSEVSVADGIHLAALDEDEYLAVMLFVNHSCEPNVGFAGNIVLVTMRDVAAGEELTIDYAMMDDVDLPMTCRCGTASCRGTVSGRDWRLPELQARYGPYFSWYLQDKIRRQRGVVADGVAHTE